MPASTDLDFDMPSDTAKQPGRHPCCAAPDLSDPAAPAATRHPQATTHRNDAITDKGEDQ
ncbi:hypothetical protein [Mesorhizobium sp. ES1-4]|uniref:hypothetical protein n=1 Tax=Mesorhizobium sp. ES1-4 TaxID=2876627 RepID=UPI001CCFEC39|nr:hypothetical protein [Mesorhizobium sp. ES1-4]MBZ9797684.1 hypothetical protein [Mesorhizobium sp. ES1-4]